MNYLYVLVPLVFGAAVWLLFYGLGKLLEDVEGEQRDLCQHVIYPDDTVCLRCEKDVGNEHFS